MHGVSHLHNPHGYNQHSTDWVGTELFLSGWQHVYVCMRSAHREEVDDEGAIAAAVHKVEHQVAATIRRIPWLKVGLTYPGVD